MQLRRGAQHMAGEGGQRAAARAAAGHVADHHHPAAVDLEGVVEVAADPVLLPRRAVQRGEAEARDLRQRGRQQRALERARDRRALAVEPRVLHREAGAPPDLRAQLEVGLVKAPRLGVDERDHAVGVPLAATIGTITTSACQAAHQLEQLGSSTASVSSSSGISGTSCGWPSRRTWAEPPRRSCGRVLLGELARELDLGRVAVDDRDLRGSRRCGRACLTPHQSASSGTARPATSRSVCS